MENKFDKCLTELNIELNELQKSQFFQFYELLVEKNKVMNLTAITEYEDVVIKHFIDSLSIVKTININDYSTVIDVGTGAGFPAIPLKIAFPHLEIVCLDSLNKRVKFINETCNTIGLHNIKAIHGRAEDIARNIEYREKFDLCVSRAVANLSTLCEYCMPFVKIKGAFVCYKSADIENEINAAGNAIALLSGNIKSMQQFVLPCSDVRRSFVVIEKTAPIANKYPRKAGTPSKEPL
ncbi:MAG: 16S rRNA (guanine(527)-N(7))-methyltransferase RsmG [Eubacterium sp.]